MLKYTINSIYSYKVCAVSVYYLLFIPEAATSTDFDYHALDRTLLAVPNSHKSSQNTDYVYYFQIYYLRPSH